MSDEPSLETAALLEFCQQLTHRLKWCCTKAVVVLVEGKHVHSHCQRMYFWPPVCQTELTLVHS